MKVLRWTLPLVLVACGGSGPGTGQLQLQLTDAPVDDADHVYIQFAGIEVQNQNGTRQTFSFDNHATTDVVEAKTFDLLTLQSGNAAVLLAPVTVPAGNYSWLRLMVNAEFDGGTNYSCIDNIETPINNPSNDIVTDSCIIIQDKQYDLWVPSGSETGLKVVSGFTVPQGGLANFTIDFDLRHSIVAPPGHQPGYMLKPVLRMVNNATVGSIAGSIAAGVIATQCADNGSALGAVYVYSGSGVTPDDIDGDAGDPITAANIVHNGDGTYSYTVAFLDASVGHNTYTISYTCDAANETTSNGTLGNDSLVFFGTDNVSVVANTVTVHNF